MENSKKSNKAFILGAGGHAKVLFHLIRRYHFESVVFVDNNENLIGQFIQESEVLSESFAADFEGDFINGIGSFDHLSAIKRKEVFLKYENKYFPVLVHSSVNLCDDLVIGKGSQIHMGCNIQNGVFVGENSILNTACSIDHDCEIGNHVHIAPRVVMSGGVRIGDTSLVGVGAVLKQNIHVGSGSMIGAGSVVLNDVPDNEVWVGAPAKKIKDLAK